MCRYKCVRGGGSRRDKKKADGQSGNSGSYRCVLMVTVFIWRGVGYRNQSNSFANQMNGKKKNGGRIEKYSSLIQFQSGKQK